MLRGEQTGDASKSSRVFPRKHADGCVPATAIKLSKDQSSVDQTRRSSPTVRVTQQPYMAYALKGIIDQYATISLPSVRHQTVLCKLIRITRDRTESEVTTPPVSSKRPIFMFLAKVGDLRNWQQDFTVPGTRRIHPGTMSLTASFRALRPTIFGKFLAFSWALLSHGTHRHTVLDRWRSRVCGGSQRDCCHVGFIPEAPVAQQQSHGDDRARRVCYAVVLWSQNSMHVGPTPWKVSLT